jgi:hypothetical protein
MDSNSQSFDQSELANWQANIDESIGGRQQYRYRFRRNRSWNGAMVDRAPADSELSAAAMQEPAQLHLNNGQASAESA